MRASRRINKRVSMDEAGQKIFVEINKKYDDIEIDEDRICEVVTGVCRQFGVSSARVSIAVLDDATIRGVNKKHLRHDWSTDVISFDLSDDMEDYRSFEVVVNGETAVRQAKLRGHSSESEAVLYVIHGVLHNLGFDDGDERGRREMHDMEDEILQKSGYGIIYRSEIK